MNDELRQSLAELDRLMREQAALVRLLVENVEKLLEARSHGL